MLHPFGRFSEARVRSVRDLDVPEVRSGERQGAREDLPEQLAQPEDSAEVFGQIVQAPHRVRCIEPEAHC